MIWPISNLQHKPHHTWDQACDLVLERGNELYAVGPIDRGVNFFILALEELGAQTRFSCEGHPKGFYISFSGPYELVCEIHSAGFFTVEIEGANRWSIRKRVAELMLPQYSEREKLYTLRGATDAWLYVFNKRLSKTLKQIAIGQLVKP